MNPIARILPAAVVLGAALLAADARAAGDRADGPWWSRFRAGVFATPLLRLQDRQRSADDSFLGTITRLEEERDPFPFHPHVDYVAHRFLVLRLSYETLASRTGTAEGDSDGEFRFAGPALSLRARYPNDSAFTPGLAVSAIWYGARFDEDGRWGNGFPGDDEGRAEYRDWLAQGRPPWPNDGYQRRLDPESHVVGLELAATLEVAVDEHWRIEAFARYVRADVRVRYTLRYYGNLFQDRGWYDFPHDHVAFGIGVIRQF